MEQDGRFLAESDVVSFYEDADVDHIATVVFFKDHIVPGMFITYYSATDLLLSIPISTTLMQDEYVNSTKWGSAADPNMLAMHLIEKTVQAFLAGAAGQELKAKRNTMSMVINRHKKTVLETPDGLFLYEKAGSDRPAFESLVEAPDCLEASADGVPMAMLYWAMGNIDNIKTFGPCYYVVGTTIS